MRQKYLVLMGLIFSFACCSIVKAGTDLKVGEVVATLPEFPQINIVDTSRFLNDLMLSPYWKVEKSRTGSFISYARRITFEKDLSGTSDQFLFAYMQTVNKQLPPYYQITNGSINGSFINQQKYSSRIRLRVEFDKTESPQITWGNSQQKVALGIYESFDKKIGLNSNSILKVKLNSKDAIYLVLEEYGNDPLRKLTFAELHPALIEIKRLADSPEKYRADERYAEFYKLFFASPLQDHELKRFHEIQERDTFCGYLRTKPATSYNGINIKISHPIYCPVEGTRNYSRLAKAEYLGKPTAENDLVFFLIEDNAVYLQGEYDERFGIFTGKESFDGTLEVLNDQGKALLTTIEKFKSWQR